jgi:two-component system response regulator PilR (NtrC family)
MWNPWAETQASEGLRERLQWFLFGRVVVISCFLGVVAVSYLSSGEERYLVSVNRLLLAIVVTYAFSIVSALLLTRLERLGFFTHVQMAYDVGLVTGVVYLTGGTGSPFGFLYSLPIVNSAVLLFAGGAFSTAILAALLYDGLLVSLLSGVLEPASDLIPPEPFDMQAGLRLAMMNLTFLLIAFLASILTRRLHTAENLLREREAERDYLAMLKEILARTIDSGLITTDREGSITSADPTACEICGRGNLVGADIGAAFPQLRLTPSARLKFLQSGARSEPIEFSHTLADGETRPLRCVAAPLRDTFGHPIGALYVMQNVAAMKELEDQPNTGEAVEAISGEQLGAAALGSDADGFLGANPVICQVRSTIRRVAGSDATVLIGGESGTGKEIVARAIHAQSRRCDKPFVAINCGAIPEHLIESELFGHVRGAFTGAVANRAGCFRAADGGSIFLDEIGDLPLHLQVKLLRVIQERVFRPVGSETSVAVDVRIIAATNRDLRAQVEAGRFREDLFYRLNVIGIDLPPLRERREDIPLLVRHFLAELGALHGRPAGRFSPEAARFLMQHDYPGNVRELENIVEHAIAMCDGEVLTEEHLPPYVLNPQRTPGERSAPPRVEREDGPREDAWVARAPEPALPADLEQDLAEYEKAIILRALDQAGGVKKRAAEILGINYRSLRHRLQKYGINGGDLSL